MYFLTWLDGFNNVLKKSLKFDFIPCRKGLRGRGTQRIHIQEREIKRDSGETRSSVYLHLTDVG